jgi:hypothetical protein
MIVPGMMIEVSEADKLKASTLPGVTARKMRVFLRGAVNDAAKVVQKEFGRSIQRLLGSRGPVGRVLRSIPVNKATTQRLVAFVTVKRKRIPLWALGARQTGRTRGTGVSYAMGGRREFIPHAFLQTMPRSGHTGVFLRRQRYPGGPMEPAKPRRPEDVGVMARMAWRTGLLKRRPWSPSELPIYEQYGPTFAAILNQMPAEIESAVNTGRARLRSAFWARVGKFTGRAEAAAAELGPLTEA